MRAGPLGSLQRGVLNLRANRELILLLWLQRGLVALLSLASLVPFYLVLDIDLPGSQSTPEEYLSWVARSSERFLEQATTVPFWMAVLSSSALLMVVLFVASFFQAGAFGVLAAADGRAMPGEADVGRFRVFSWVRFQDLAGAYLWRFFWLLNLILGLWLLWALLGALALLASGVAAGSTGLAAGLAMGCLSVLPLAAGVAALTFWGWLAQAELSLRKCSVWAALGSGLRVLFRQLGTMLVLFVLLAILTGGTMIVFLMLTLTLEAGLAAFDTARTALWWVLQVLQWGVSAVIHLTFSAALVAVARADRTASTATEEE